MTDWEMGAPYRARHRRKIRNRVAGAWSRRVLRWNGVNR
jgi:hypothetical protein